MWVLLGLYILTEAMFSLTPGPAMLLVVSVMMRYGFKAAHYAIAGVLVGNLIYFGLSGLILMGIAEFNEQLFRWVKVFGAVYLLVHLLQEFIRSRKAKQKDEQTPVEEQLVPIKSHHYFWASFMLQLSNPHTILFFSAFLPQFIVLEYSIPLQIGVMALLSTLIEYTILRFVLQGVDRLSSRIGLRRTQKFSNWGNATMLVAIVWSLAVDWLN